jgi:hypothetical protein
LLTTTSCPPRTRRRAMLAPIRPNPIIPHCIGFASRLIVLYFSIASNDQLIHRAR